MFLISLMLKFLIKIAASFYFYAVLPIIIISWLIQLVVSTQLGISRVEITNAESIHVPSFQDLTPTILEDISIEEKYPYVKFYYRLAGQITDETSVSYNSGTVFNHGLSIYIDNLGLASLTETEAKEKARLSFKEKLESFQRMLSREYQQLNTIDGNIDALSMKIGLYMARGEKIKAWPILEEIHKLKDLRNPIAEKIAIGQQDLIPYLSEMQKKNPPGDTKLMPSSNPTAMKWIRYSMLALAILLPFVAHFWGLPKDSPYRSVTGCLVNIFLACVVWSGLILAAMFFISPWLYLNLERQAAVFRNTTWIHVVLIPLCIWVIYNDFQDRLVMPIEIDKNN